MIAQLVDAVTDRVPYTEAIKEPVIGMPTAVVDGTAIATIVAAVLAGWRGGTL